MTRHDDAAPAMTGNARSPRGWLALAGAAATIAGGLTTTVVQPALAMTPTAAVTPRVETPAVSAASLPKATCPPDATGADACDLYARAGTATLASVNVPVWGFTLDGTAPTAPGGPTLVVTSGDKVSLTLHNQLPVDTPVSLGLPQVPGQTDDVSGAAQGGTKTYTFTAPAPGTYLYQAGNTPDGAREDLMGLYGALVVRPADGSPSDFGSGSGSDFDDQAVLVLGEVDPAFNADPMGYDLRNFAPAYRLINGAVAPSVPVVGTSPGHTVLLRYANAGSLDHAMTVGGLQQTLIAVGGTKQTFPQAETTARLIAGDTQDVLVSVPSDSGVNYAVYDQGQRLDNNGMRVGTTPVYAFGGMMTYLDTTATPSADTAGPAVSNVAVSPTVADGLTAVNLTADASDASTGGNNVSRMEWVLDSGVTTVSPGSGTALDGVGGSTVSVTGATSSVPIVGLTPGTHSVWVRAQDSLGNWGSARAAVFHVPGGGAVTKNLKATPVVTNGDVVLAATGDDTDMGGNVASATWSVAGGNSGSMTLATPGQPTSTETARLTPTDLGTTDGVKTVSVQTTDSFGNAGPAATVNVTLDQTAPTLTGATVSPAGARSGSVTVSVSAVDALSGVSRVEWFVDSLGAPGTGTAMSNPSGASYAGSISLTGRSQGSHFVYLRAIDAAGNADAVTTSFIYDSNYFADGFESGTTSAWASKSVTGNPVAATTTMTGSYALRAGRNVYVTHNEGVAMSELHATFQLNASALSVSNNNTVDLWQATGSTGSPLYGRVQLRVSSGARQVRVVGNGAPSAWLALPTTGPVTVHVDLTGGAGGAIRLSLSSSTTAVSAAQTGTVAVTRQVLGVMGNAASSSTSSVAWFDQYAGSKFQL